MILFIIVLISYIKIQDWLCKLSVQHLREFSLLRFWDQMRSQGLCWDFLAH